MPFQLDNQLPISAEDPSNRSFLKKLQGNILRGHGRDGAIYLFVQFGDDAGATRAGIRALSEHVTSADDQREAENAYRRKRAEGGLNAAPSPVFCNLFLAKEGYRALGYSDAEIRQIAPEPVRADVGVKPNFFDGMKKHGEDLHDPPVNSWADERYRGRIDMLVVLAEDDDDSLEQKATELRALIATFGAIVIEEEGEALRTADADGFEHFGFVDGRSQPIFFAENLPGEGDVGTWNPLEPLSLVLVKDGGVPGDDEAFGSFFVFRKLEQNVRDFVRAERRLAEAMALPDSELERAGAAVMGRFRDGTPLVTHATPGQAPDANDFRFDGQHAERCPFHSHIRKSNPRGDIAKKAGHDDDRATERRRRIVRRSIPYGKLVERPSLTASDPEALPAADVGLLFGCFQACIGNQFAHIQNRWMNEPAFIQPGTGVDPLLSQQPADTTFQWPTAWGGVEKRGAGFGRFVTMMGGEFFFAPSLPFLWSL